MLRDGKLRRWLLAVDEPAIRYRLLRWVDGLSERDPSVRAARRQVLRAGWGSRIRGQQLAEGQWDTPGTTGQDLYTPKYIATNWRLIVLAEMGATRSDPGIERAAELLLRREGTAQGGIGGKGSEVCFTGNAVRMLARMGFAEDRRVGRAIDWLVRHQKKDGGWHCFRSSTGTLDGWEAMAAFAALPDALRTPAVDRSVERGAEFYLRRQLLREGRVPYPPWTRLHFPNHYYYDYLVGLDMLTSLGYGDDPRIRPALDRLLERRNSDGSWDIDASHPDIPPDDPYQPRTPIYPFVLEAPGRPSRWITVTALAVLGRAGRLAG